MSKKNRRILNLFLENKFIPKVDLFQRWIDEKNIKPPRNYGKSKSI